MNRRVNEKLISLAQRMLRRVVWLAGKGTWAQNAQAEFVPIVVSQVPHVCICLPGTYVSVTRSYKAISRRELKAIVNNEAEFLSPFASTRILHTEQDHQDGTWTVHYFFIDRTQFFGSADASIVLLGEYLFDTSSQRSSVIETALGDFFVGRINGQPVVKPFSPSLSAHWLSVTTDELERTRWSNVDLRARIISWAFLSRAVVLRGSFNGVAVAESIRKRVLQPKILTVIGLAVIAWIATQSAYLLGVEALLDYRQNSNSEIRDTYANEKRDYLDRLDTVKSMDLALTTRSDITRVARILADLRTLDGLELNRFDFVESEYRIGGVTPDIDELMALLRSKPELAGLDFMAPIMPDRSGKDRFQLRFELVGQ